MSAPQRLLIIDDQEAIVFAMADYLSSLGYEVDAARNAYEALGLLAHGEYSLVLADLRLDPEDTRGGLDVLRVAREHCRSTPLILLTAYDSTEVEAQVRELGSVLLLSKPQPLARIGEQIGRLLAPPCV
ncbi:MAG TPA: response regulator [Thermoanaerobaculia bacterium]|nr:response regulator [Thermoanaerobaculia bacterium]